MSYVSNIENKKGNFMILQRSTLQPCHRKTLYVGPLTDFAPSLAHGQGNNKNRHASYDICILRLTLNSFYYEFTVLLFTIHLKHRNWILVILGQVRIFWCHTYMT